jgi:2-phospho-L-lactate guanylyltransferase
LSDHLSELRNLKLHKFPVTKQAIWAVVPVKTLDQSKQRLESCLGDIRHELTVAMFIDLLDSLKSSELITNTAIVTADLRVKSIANRYGVLVVDEKQSGDMNLAISQGVEAVRQAGGTHAAIFPADIPLARGEEIDRLINTMLAAGKNSLGPVVGICPSADKGGTNFLYLETAYDFPFQYGPDSYHLHLKSASEASCQVVIVSSPTISLDIDHQTDLDAYISYCTNHSGYENTQTWHFVSSSGYLDEAEVRQSNQ